MFNIRRTMQSIKENKTRNPNFIDTNRGRFTMTAEFLYIARELTKMGAKSEFT